MKFLEQFAEQGLTEQESFELESTKSHIMFPIVDKKKKKQITKNRYGVVGRLSTYRKCGMGSGHGWKIERDTA